MHSPAQYHYIHGSADSRHVYLLSAFKDVFRLQPLSVCQVQNMAAGQCLNCLDLGVFFELGSKINSISYDRVLQPALVSHCPEDDGAGSK